jgi:hypothetical protein
MFPSSSHVLYTLTPPPSSSLKACLMVLVGCYCKSRVLLLGLGTSSLTWQCSSAPAWRQKWHAHTFLCSRSGTFMNKIPHQSRVLGIVAERLGWVATSLTWHDHHHHHHHQQVPLEVSHATWEVFWFLLTWTLQLCVCIYGFFFMMYVSNEVSK